MKVMRGIALAGLMVVLTAGCGASGAGNQSPSRTSTANSATSSATETPPTSSTTKAQGGQEPATAYASALDALENAPTVTYSVRSAVAMGTDSIQTEREVLVDAGRELASTRVRLQADVPGKPKTDLTMLIINTADTAFLNMPAWTDSRRGKWMRITDESAASMGVPLDLSAPSTVPPGLAEFSATTIRDGGKVEGTLDAQSQISGSR